MARKALYLLTLIFVLGATSAVQAAGVCSTELFPKLYASDLFWQEEGRTFGLGLPLSVYALNPYDYNYQTVSYEGDEVKFTPTNSVGRLSAKSTAKSLGIYDRVFPDEGPGIPFFISTDGQIAVYIDVIRLHAIDLNNHIDHEIRMDHAIGGVDQIAWLDAETFLMMTHYVEGEGHELVKVDLRENSIRYLTEPIDNVLGVIAISTDKKVAVVPGLIPDTSSRTTLYWIDLTKTDTNNYTAIKLPFFVIQNTPPLWSTDGRNLYVIGEESTGYGIYRLTFEGDQLVEETQVAALQDASPDVIDTKSWLVDPVHHLSIHALNTGGVKFFCWASN